MVNQSSQYPHDSLGSGRYDHRDGGPGCIPSASGEDGEEVKFATSPPIALVVITDER